MPKSAIWKVGTMDMDKSTILEKCMNLPCISYCDLFIILHGENELPKCL